MVLILVVVNWSVRLVFIRRRVRNCRCSVRILLFVVSSGSCNYGSWNVIFIRMFLVW